MEEQPRQTLCEIIATYGRPVCDDQRRCESLLRDKCGAYRREIFVLMSALRERVTVDLQVSSRGTPPATVLARLTQRLEDNLALTSTAARWAVESWALALGMLTLQDLSPPPVLLTPPMPPVPLAPSVPPALRWTQRRGGLVLGVGLGLLLAVGAVVVTHWLHQYTIAKLPGGEALLRVERERDQARVLLQQATTERDEARRGHQQAEKERNEIRAQRQQVATERDQFRMLLQQALATHQVPPSPSSGVSGPTAPPSEVRTGAASLQSPPVSPQLDNGATHYNIRQMLIYAMTNGGMDNEADIAAAKRRMEARPSVSTTDPGTRRQARAANDQGRKALQGNRIAEAIQAFQTAQKTDPTDVEIINNLGYAYMFQGDLQTAEWWLLQALELSPGRAIAWANLGHVYAAQENLKAAVACFANAYRFAVNKTTIRKSLESLARDHENVKVREAASQALQLQLVRASAG